MYRYQMNKKRGGEEEEREEEEEEKEEQEMGERDKKLEHEDNNIN